MGTVSVINVNGANISDVTVSGINVSDVDVIKCKCKWYECKVMET